MTWKEAIMAWTSPETAYGRLQENEFYNGESRQRV